MKYILKVSSNEDIKETLDAFVFIMRASGMVAEIEKVNEAYTDGSASDGKEESQRKIWDYLAKKIDNEYGVAGLMGNLDKESALRSNNAQNSGNAKLDMADEEYTAAVDNGSYPSFCTDKIGYGLAQWTIQSRKSALYDFVKSRKKTIGDLDSQLDFLVKELQTDYKNVWRVLCDAKSVKEASDIVLTKFEMPKDQSDKNKEARAERGQYFYDKFSCAYFKYEIKYGENLTKICDKFGVPKKEVIELNNIVNPDKLYAGDYILIPKR